MLRLERRFWGFESPGRHHLKRGYRLKAGHLVLSQAVRVQVPVALPPKRVQGRLDMHTVVSRDEAGAIPVGPAIFGSVAKLANAGDLKPP